MTLTISPERVASTPADILRTITVLEWQQISVDLDTQGYAIVPELLNAEQCTAIADLYERPELFRARISMSRHNFGQGEYKYFAYPLPPIISDLRSSLYPPLAAIANRWADLLDTMPRFPLKHTEFIEQCRAADQVRPTPLLLHYSSGDYNCLHQDIYGDLVFPLQVAILLRRPGIDFSGGEFVLTEQRPRMQSRVEVVPLALGDGVIFPVHHRPVKGTRGIYRVNLRHGVSRVRAGRRDTLGIIFHDSK